MSWSEGSLARRSVEANDRGDTEAVGARLKVTETTLTEGQHRDG